jgi:hypothetical protein
VEREVIYIDAETYLAVRKFVERPPPELSGDPPLYIAYFRRLRGGLAYAVYHGDGLIAVEVSYDGVEECGVRRYLTAALVTGGRRKRRFLSAVYDQSRNRFYVVVEGVERVLMLPPNDDVALAMSEYSDKIPVRRITEAVCAAAGTTLFCRAAGPLKR